jgi:hypothetical protein
VELTAVYKTLKGYGLPLSLINYINWINSTPPKIFRKDLDPTDQEIKKSITEFEGGINKETEHLDKIGLPQGLPWSPILAIAVLDKYLVSRYPQVRISLFADDGIIFSDDKSIFEKIRTDPFLKMVGIVFSDKLRSDGTPATGLIDGKIIKFVGCELDLNTGIISSEKGSLHADSPIDDINKII